MAAWPKRQMDSLCEVTSSKRIFASDYVSKGVPFYRAKEIGEKHHGNVNVSTELFISRSQFEQIRARFGAPKGGDVLLTSIGALLGLPYVVKQGEEFYFKDGNLTWFRNLNGIDSQFLYYWMLSPEGNGELQKSKIGSAQPAFTINLLKRMEIGLPPLPIQRRVAGVLFAYDGLIENNARRIKILAEMAKMIYREWFVSFRFPGYEKVKMVESDDGLIPNGWNAKRLGEVLQLEYGKALKSADRGGGAVPVFGSSGVVGFHTESLADWPGIIVGRKGNVGSVFFCPSKFWVIDTAYYVHTSLSQYFLFLNLLTQNFLNNDAAVPGLNRNQAHSLPIIVPDATTMERFDHLVAPMFRQQTVLRELNTILTKTRDLLLPKLVSGEIEVGKIEAGAIAQGV
jgi:type I restriction enzyme S subunit